MVYLIAAVVGLLASVVSLLLYVKVAADGYRRRSGLTEGEIGISIFSPPLLLIILAAFLAGFYAVLRISK